MADGRDPTLERTFRGHKGGITSVSFQPGVKQVVSASEDACLMVWNFRPQLRAFRFVGHKVGVPGKKKDSSGPAERPGYALRGHTGA